MSPARPSTPNELDRLQERLAKLAQEKSSLQLVNDLMAKLSLVPGVEPTAEALVRLLSETIGGANIALYYWLDGATHYVDILGSRRVLSDVDDALVAAAARDRRLTEGRPRTSTGYLDRPELADGASWAIPLLVGEELIGVVKAEALLLRGHDAQQKLDPFFRYAALVLRNEALGHSRLVGANRELAHANERLRLEMEARAKEHGFLEALLESLHAVIIACDAHGVVTFCNRTCRALYEPPPGPLHASELTRRFGLHRADGRSLLPSDESPLQQALHGHHVDNLEVVRLAEGHPPRTFSASARPIVDAAGVTRGAVVALQDITETKRLESQLRHAQKLEAVGQLAAGIAHELNTPAQFVNDSITFLADAFRDTQALVEQYQSAMGTLYRGSSPSGHVVEAVLKAEEDADLVFLAENVPAAFARVQEGMSRIATIVRAMKEFAHPDAKEKVPADLNRALQATLTIARNEYKYVAEVETDFGPLPLVTCRVGELNQVFLNLLVNAAHAIGDVVKDSGALGRIRVTTRQEGHHARVDISDTGCGIPEAIRERVFDPFFTTKPVGRGTGQGLAIARSIVVDKHGGSLTFDSTPGKGTTFTILVPLEPPGEPSRGTP